MRRKRKRSASSHPGLALPKGLTRRATKLSKRNAQNERLFEVRRQVWARSRGRDEVTGARLAPDQGEMHEAYPRSKTRGMAPEFRFHTAWCLRVSSKIHESLTHHKSELLFVDARGCDNPNGIVQLQSTSLAERKRLGVPMAPFLTAEEVWWSARLTLITLYV